MSSMNLNGAMTDFLRPLTFPVDGQRYSIKLPTSRFSVAQDLAGEWLSTRQPRQSSGSWELLVSLEYLEVVLQAGQHSSTQNSLIAKSLLDHIEHNLLASEEIRSILRRSATTAKDQDWATRCYYGACATLEREPQKVFSSLLEQGSKGSVRILALFGTSNNLDFYQESRALYRAYKAVVADFLVELLRSLETVSISSPPAYLNGISKRILLHLDDSTPIDSTLLSPCLRSPLIAITQLVSYHLVYRLTHKTPAALRDCLSAVGGCFEGNAVAAVILTANTDFEFRQLSCIVIKALLVGSLHEQKSRPLPSLPPSIITESEEQGLESPTTSLITRQLPLSELQGLLSTINSFLPAYSQISYRWFRGANVAILQGPAVALHGLRSRILAARGNGLELYFIPVLPRLHGVPEHDACGALQALMSTNELFESDYMALFSAMFLDQTMDLDHPTMPMFWEAQTKDAAHGGYSDILDFSLGNLNQFSMAALIEGFAENVSVIAASKTSDMDAGFQQQYAMFNPLHIQSTIQIDFHLKLAGDLELGHVLSEAEMKPLQDIDPTIVSRVPWLKALLEPPSFEASMNTSLSNPFQTILRRDRLGVVVFDGVKDPKRAFVYSRSTNDKSSSWSPMLAAILTDDNKVEMSFAKDASLIHPRPLSIFQFDSSGIEGGLFTNVGYTLDAIKEYLLETWFPLKSPAGNINRSIRAVIQKTNPSMELHNHVWRFEVCSNSYEVKGHTFHESGLLVGWKGFAAPLISPLMDLDLSKMRLTSISLQAKPSAVPFFTVNLVQCTSRIKEIVVSELGKVAKVEVGVHQDSTLALTMTATFLFVNDFNRAGTFIKSNRDDMSMVLRNSKEVALLLSRKWFRTKLHFSRLLRTTLEFHTSSILHQQLEGTEWSKLDVKGHADIYNGARQRIGTALVSFSATNVTGDPVFEFLERHGTRPTRPALLRNDCSIPLSVPSGTLLNKYFDRYNNLPQHLKPFYVPESFSACTSFQNFIEPFSLIASVHETVSLIVANGDAGRVANLDLAFNAPGSANQNNFQLLMKHSAMHAGHMCIQGEAQDLDGNSVLHFNAEVEEKLSIYTFTGQGSQRKNMGMDLRASSSAARNIWDRADKHLFERYGFKITEIILQNPKSISIHFGGLRGSKVRQYYQRLTTDGQHPNANRKNVIFPSLNHRSDFINFRSPDGLLSVTQFAQLALTLHARAAFADLRNRQLVPERFVFAGHSLGEFSALAAVTDLVSVEDLASFVFQRGCSAQNMVSRDKIGGSDYRMCAINPKAIHPEMSGESLQAMVDYISASTGFMIEVVNFNVRDNQYVCAGTTQATSCLVEIALALGSRGHECGFFSSSAPFLSAKLIDYIRPLTECIPPLSADRKSKAVIVLRGIDVPFHSSVLNSDVSDYRRALQSLLAQSRVELSDLDGRYIPNLVAEPFSLNKSFVQRVYDVTKSPVLDEMLRNWDGLKN